MAMKVVPQSAQLDVGGPLLAAAGGLPPPQAARNKARVNAPARLHAVRNADVNIRTPRGVVGTESPNAAVRKRLTRRAFSRQAPTNIAQRSVYAGGHASVPSLVCARLRCRRIPD